MAMQNVRIDPSQRVRNDDQVALKERQQRIYLFTRSQVESQRETFAGIGKQDLSAISSGTGDSEQQRAQREEEVEEKKFVKLKDGTRLELPRITPEQAAQVRNVLQSTGAEQAELMTDAGRVYAAEAYKEVDEGRVDGPYSLSATKAAVQAVDTYMVTTGETDQQNAMAGALIFGMYGHEQNLRDFFEKVAAEQDLATEVKTDVAMLDDILQDMEEGDSEYVTYREVVFNEDGTQTVVVHNNELMTKDQIEALKIKLQGDAENLGNIHDQDLTKLQVMIQRWQQAMTALSNILQNVHDTQKGIIANTRA